MIFIIRNIHVLQRPGDYEDVRRAKDLYYKENDVKGAFKAMPFMAGAEKAVLGGLVSGGDNAFANAIGKIQQKLRMMYVHAYQSYIFNKAVSLRLELFSK